MFEHRNNGPTNHTSRCRVGVSAWLGIALVMALVPAQASFAQPPAELFRIDEKSPTQLSMSAAANLAKIEQRSSSTEVRIVELANLEPLVRAEPINVHLFPGIEVTVGSAWQTVRSAEDFTYIGTTDDDSGQAILVVRDGDIVGNVRTPSGLFRIRPLGDGHHAVIRVNPDNWPLDHPPTSVDWQPADPAPVRHQSSFDATKAGMLKANTSIEVLVAYTTEVDNEVSNIQSLIQLAVDETNVSYARSNVSIVLSLAATMEVAYNESGSHWTDLDRFEDQYDNHMDEIHLQRDLNGADVSVLLIDDDDYCGLASQIDASRTTAFATVHFDCATGNYSFGHELGHLQAARHDNDSSNNPYAYGHGYWNAPDDWRTIMGVYRSGVTRIQNWSNPDIDYSGDPTGTSASNDNARVLDNTRAEVAGFRGAVSNNQSHKVHGIASCMGENLECQILTHENVTLSGTIQIHGGGISSNWTHIGYRCGSSSTFDEFIEVYVNDTDHDWSWPNYCLRDGDTLALNSGWTYDFRGPSIAGGSAFSFNITSYTPPPLSVYITRAGLWNPPQEMTAHASGGTSPYTYAWYRKPVCSGGGGGGPVPLKDIPLKDVPCTSWYGPFYTSPPNKWTPYQGPNQNIKVVVTDSAGATKTAYSYTD